MQKNSLSIRFATRFAIAVVFVSIMLLSHSLPSPALAGGAFNVSLAQPQPDTAALRPGLAVDYAYGEVRFLDEATGWASHTKPGAPLAGFVYGDTEVGQQTFTSDSSEFVIAFIEGFMKFEAGTYDLEFQSNDGLRITLGGVQVYEHDGRHTCQTNGVVQITVPKTGWYAVTALYFNRKFTACMDLSIRSQGGDWDFTSPDIYAHLPK